jgi:predicted anti-sigma-YlaC factor YlaD
VAVLQDYFDGTLDPKLAAAIERHFRNCPDCRAFSKTYGETVRLTGELATDDIPEEVRNRVRNALRERSNDGV